MCRLADDFTGIEPGSYDAVIVNSVVEYLPGVETLLRVIDGAIRSVRKGGRVFIGDVPALARWDLFHATAQLEHADDSLSAAQLRERIRHAVSRGSRLLLDPDFFGALPHRDPRVRGVEVRLARARFATEASRRHAETYFDVVLHLDGVDADAPAPVLLDWEDEPRTRPSLESRLEAKADAVLVRGVPLTRLAVAARTLELLDAPGGPETVAELRGRLAGVAGEDLDGWRRISERLGYALDWMWSGSGKDGRCDLLFRRLAPSGAARGIGISRGVSRPKPWAEYANDPARFALARRLVPEIRAHVKQTLPAFMVPAAIEILDALPQTANAKVDYRALPAPRGLHLLAEDQYAAPRTGTEKTLAGIWADVLRLDRVGIRDDVFELGGDSLMIFQIATRANQAGIPMAPRDLFQFRTIVALSEALGGDRGAASSERVPLVAASREAHRVSRASLRTGADEAESSA